MSNSDAPKQNTTSLPSGESSRPTNATMRSSLFILLSSFGVYATLFIICLLPHMFIMGLNGETIRVQELVVELTYGIAFALPLAILAWLRLHVLRDARGVQKLTPAILTVLSFIAAVFFMYARGYLPDTSTSWNALPHPPVLLAKLLKTSPINALGGDVYGETAAGKIYGYYCGYSINCGWEAVDTLPPPPDPKSYWSGSCGSEGGMGSLWLEPSALGQVVDRLVTHYCGPDYSIETHFLLTSDGTVWSLQKWGGMVDLFIYCLNIPLGVVIAVIGALTTRRLARGARAKSTI